MTVSVPHTSIFSPGAMSNPAIGFRLRLLPHLPGPRLLAVRLELKDLGLRRAPKQLFLPQHLFKLRLLNAYCDRPVLLTRTCRLLLELLLLHLARRVPQEWRLPLVIQLLRLPVLLPRSLNLRLAPLKRFSPFATSLPGLGFRLRSLPQFPGPQQVAASSEPTAEMELEKRQRPARKPPSLAR